MLEEAVVPHSRSAKKKVRQSETRRVRNRSSVSALRTEIKKFQAAVDASDIKGATERMRLLSRQLDKLVTRGLVHKNQAARRKSRMTQKVKILSAAKSA